MICDSGYISSAIKGLQYLETALLDLERTTEKTKYYQNIAREVIKDIRAFARLNTKEGV